MTLEVQAVQSREQKALSQASTLERQVSRLYSCVYVQWCSGITGSLGICALLHYSYIGTIDKSSYLSFSINDIIFEVEKFYGSLAIAGMCVGKLSI